MDKHCGNVNIMLELRCMFGGDLKGYESGINIWIDGAKVNAFYDEDDEVDYKKCSIKA